MKILISLALITFSLTSIAQKSPHSHQHGKGVLEMGIEGRTLSGTLEMPLEALLGFEHAPKTGKERSAQSKLETRLGLIDAWFEINPEAQCTPKSPQTKLDRDAQAKHSDLLYTFSYSCSNPGALKEIRLLFFKEYPSIKEVKVEVASPKGQRLIMASPKSPIVRF
ncbi:DUF2796 domain-containing protein [Polynucleobacter sp.]|jgi:hypothetical protein|uniref:ZrgA family zinc uptake protein n=1 Tax=Polynucleobacter sp. TaxID=2029855 RepID=UPI0037CC104C